MTDAADNLVAQPGAAAPTAAPDPAFIAGARQNKQQRDGILGVLLCAVVLGHNRLLFENIEGYFESFYFWHGAGLFFITFANKGFRSDRAVIPDLIVRYMTPFVVVVTATSMAHWITGFSPSALGLWVLALLIGSARLCDWTTGLMLFWFLPAQTGFVVFSILISRGLRRRAITPAMIALMLLAMFALAFVMTPELAIWVPFGLVIVCYLLPLSAAHSMVVEFVRGRSHILLRALPVLIAAAFLVAQGIAITRGNQANVAIFRLALPHTPALFLFNAASALSAGLFLFLLSPLVARTVPLVRWIGERSMHVYIFHQFFQFPLFMLLRSHFTHASLPIIAVAGLMISLVTVLLSLATSLILDWLPAVKQAVFPKDVAALRESFGRVRDLLPRRLAR